MSCYRNCHFQRSAQAQRGRGIGNVLRSLYNKATPFLTAVGSKVLDSQITKEALTTVKDIAANASLNVLKETLEGKDLSKSVGNNINIAKRKLSKAFMKQLYKQVGQAKKKRVSKHRKLNYLFDDDGV
jgi:hypothetical protein